MDITFNEINASLIWCKGDGSFNIKNIANNTQVKFPITDLPSLSKSFETFVLYVVNNIHINNDDGVGVLPVKKKRITRVPKSKPERPPPIRVIMAEMLIGEKTIKKTPSSKVRFFLKVARKALNQYKYKYDRGAIRLAKSMSSSTKQMVITLEKEYGIKEVYCKCKGKGYIGLSITPLRGWKLYTDIVRITNKDRKNYKKRDKL